MALHHNSYHCLQVRPLQALENLCFVWQESSEDLCAALQFHGHETW